MLSIIYMYWNKSAFNLEGNVSSIIKEELVVPLCYTNYVYRPSQVCPIKSPHNTRHSIQITHCQRFLFPSNPSTTITQIDLVNFNFIFSCLHWLSSLRVISTVSSTTHYCFHSLRCPPSIRSCNLTRTSVNSSSVASPPNWRCAWNVLTHLNSESITQMWLLQRGLVDGIF